MSRLRRFTAMLLLSQALGGCFTAIGAGMGALVPRYEDVGAVSPGATVRAETPTATLKGDVDSTNATGIVLRDARGALSRVEYRSASVLEHVGTYAGTGAIIGLVLDLCLVAGAVVAVAAASTGSSGWGAF